MIPLGDVNPRRRVPYITIALILINALVFIYQLTLPAEALDGFVLSAALIPSALTQSFDALAMRGLLTSIFMHGSWLHIIGNMLYRWIFGDTIEDLLGPIPYLLFYLLAGVVAGLAQVATDRTSTLPTIGASGAVAGVLGAYAVLYPRKRVRTLVTALVFVRFVEMPALIVLGLWFVIQLLNGLMTLGAMAVGGVAWFAHIGGFVLGMVVGWMLKGRVGARPPAYSTRRR